MTDFLLALGAGVVSAVAVVTMGSNPDNAGRDKSAATAPSKPNAPNTQHKPAQHTASGQANTATPGPTKRPPTAPHTAQKAAHEPTTAKAKNPATPAQPPNGKPRNDD